MNDNVVKMANSCTQMANSKMKKATGLISVISSTGT